MEGELSRQWRAYGLEQQALLNCRQLWTRQVAKNRRDVDEAVEKLKVLAQLGALTAGFAVSAFYDFQYTASPSDPVIPFFGLVTALTVGFELNSCVLCTLMLSSVVKAGKRYTSEEEEAEYLWRLRDWAAAATGGVPGSVPPAPRRSFARHWESRCESRWRVALAMFLAGIPTFFAVMGLAGYLKYWNSPATVVITAVLMAAAFVYTVGMTADWAKSLLGRRTAGGEDTLGWQGAWWSALEPAQRLPFAFHQVPHKDVCWPPPSSAAAAAASVASTAGDEHERPRAGGSAAAATTAAPYLAHTLAELPYPAIIGLQPWPTELALGVVPTMFGAHAGAHVGVVAGEAGGIAPPAPAAGAEQRMPVPGTQRWRQHSAVPREGPMEAGQRAVAGAAAAAAAAGARGAAGSDGHVVAAGADLRPWPGGHVGGTSCSGGGVGVSGDAGTAAQWAGENPADDSADTEEVAAELALRPGTSAIAVLPVPDPALLPAGEHRLQLPPPPASVCLHRAPCGDAACSERGASTAGPSGTTGPQAARKGVQGLMRALGSACGGASVEGGSGSGSAGGGTGPGSGSGAGGEGGAPGSRPAANGIAGVVDDGSLQVARPHPLPPVAEFGSEDAFEAAAPWYAEDTASARVTTDSLRSCESILEDGSDEDGRGAST